MQNWIIAVLSVNLSFYLLSPFSIGQIDKNLNFTSNHTTVKEWKTHQTEILLSM